MSFPTPNSGYAVGTGGRIMKYRDTTLTWIQSKDFRGINDFQLRQNYPNPFNPETRISFDIFDDESFVSLKLYDVVGREIRTLFEGIVNFGAHEVTVKPDKLVRDGIAGGVYFYRLTTKSKRGFSSQAKKMVFLR